MKAHLHHEMNPADIARIVLKPDGKTHYSVTTIHNIIDKLNNDPMWRGERQAGSGAPRQTTAKQDALIVKEVFKKRGRSKVTVAMLKKNFVWLRSFGNTLVEERLHEAGLQ